MKHMLTISRAALLCLLVALTNFVLPINNKVEATVPGITQPVTVDTNGVYANNGINSFATSGDGRYVVFESNASNLVPNDTNNARDIFLRDTVNNTITRVSIASDGTQANSDSTEPRISYNGRYIVYASYASNLVSNDTNGTYDIFLYDTRNASTTLVTQTASGMTGNGGSTYPDISADGRYIVFASNAFNLDPTISTNPSLQPIGQQIFVKDMVTGTIQIVSNNPNVQVNDMATNPRISCDGGTIAFDSRASNLVPNDTNGYTDVFTANRVGGANNLTDITLNGNSESTLDALSCNGNLVTFMSRASNLVSNDTNGYADIFDYNRLNQSTQLLTATPGGTQANGDSSCGMITDDGRFAVFTVQATNLVPNYSTYNKTGAPADVYIRDLRDNTLQIVDIKSDGAVSDKTSGGCGLSNDGGTVTYGSVSDDLIPGIVNPYNSYTLLYQSKTGF